MSEQPANSGQQSARISFERVAWSAGTFRLESVSFAIPAGNYAVLMGKTGCGKTTLLEILCGLRRPADGRVFIGEREVTAHPPGERGIGYVPQDGAMFPTLTVREQIGFALKIRHWSAETITARVQELSGQLGVAHLLDRLPQNLSGGELVGHIATQTAHAGDQHRGTLELPLRRLAEAGQPHLPLVDGAFFGSEFWQVHGRSLIGRTDRRKPALHRGNNLLWITANNSLRHGHDMRHPEPIRPGRVHAH